MNNIKAKKPKTVLHIISRCFIRGIGLVVPIALTSYLIYAGLLLAEKATRFLLLFFIAESDYHPGLGLLCLVAFIFAVGWCVRYLPVDGIIDWFESLIDRIPLVRTIYSSTKDLADFVAGKSVKKFSKAVVFSHPEVNIKLLGYITSDEVSKELDINVDGSVAVYFPMSYQLGGYTAIVPKAWLSEIDLPNEYTLKYILTAGIAKRPADK